MEHERQQALRLGFARQQVQKQPAQVDRFDGESFAPRIGTRDIVPPAAISSIGCFQYRAEA